LRKAVEAATESISLAQLQYDEGWIDFDRVNNLQRDLVIQQDESVAAQADVAFGLIRIYRALGGGWQLRCGGGTCLADITPVEDEACGRLSCCSDGPSDR
jgi:outer membrane protein TolC